MIAGVNSVLENLANATAPDGYLMLGAAETVIGQTSRFEASREFRGFYERSSGPVRRVKSPSVASILKPSLLEFDATERMDHSMIWNPSPNFGERTLPITMLVLHYTGMKSGAAAIDWLANPASKVSAHYVVDEDGQIVHMVREEQRAQHAGLSYWRGITDCNSASIGIEIVNPGHEWGDPPFPEEQMAALVPLVAEIVRTYSIPPRCCRTQRCCPGAQGRSG